MSTTPPTTLAPTTTLTTLAPTTVAPTDIEAGPIDIVLSTRGIPSMAPGAIRDVTKDQLLSVSPIIISLSQLGETLNKIVSDGTIDIVLTQRGSLVDSVTITDGVINLTIVPTYYMAIVEGRKCNWVAWSKIGQLDFTIDRSNIAGARPLDWRGCVYRLIKLADKVVAYGENGVTMLQARENAYGMRTIHRLGLIGRRAAIGTDSDHWFIDVTGKLYHVSSDGLELLDYSEFLGLMTDPVMSLDTEKMLIYICDETYGYVYSALTKSLGACAVNITGFEAQSGQLLVTSPATIATPVFEICTDIYDLGTRKPKTIQVIEIGVELSELMRTQVEYRLDSRASFRKSQWHLVNPDGFAFPTCYGVEFRFRLKAANYEYFELDFLKITGMVHDQTYIEALAMSDRRTTL